MAVLTSKGAAGVPGFAIIILSATLASAGLPLERVALIAGIFRIIDSGTTTHNVLGNAVAPLVIARREEEAYFRGNPFRSWLAPDLANITKCFTTKDS